MPSHAQLFGGLNDLRQQDHYAAEARQKYGADTVLASQRRWQGDGVDEQEAILAEGNAIYGELVAAIPAGAGSAPVQALVERWRRHLAHFWTPSLTQLNGLALTYRDDPRFRANFDRLDAGLADFMVAAVARSVGS